MYYSRFLCQKEEEKTQDKGSTYLDIFRQYHHDSILHLEAEELSPAQLVSAQVSTQ